MTRDLDKVFREQDEIQENRKQMISNQHIMGARIKGSSVVRRLPNGLTVIESISVALDKTPGRIWRASANT